MKKIIFVTLLVIIAGYLHAQNIQEEETRDEVINQNQTIPLNQNPKEKPVVPSDDYADENQPFDYDDCIKKCKEMKKSEAKKAKKNETKKDEAKTKSDWYIGFGIGGGRGNIEGDSFKSWFNLFGEELGAGSSSIESPVTINFGLGLILNPNLHIGWDVSAILQTAEYIYGHNEKMQIDFFVTNMLAAVTYYPNVTGFSLKGGAGFSNFDYAVDGYSEQYYGYAFLAGIGYDLWLGETFNLGLRLEYSKQYYNDSKAPKNTDFVNVYVSFYWL